MNKTEEAPDSAALQLYIKNKIVAAGTSTKEIVASATTANSVPSSIVQSAIRSMVEKGVVQLGAGLKLYPK